MTTKHLKAIRLAVAVTCTIAALGAMAQDTPYYIGAAQAFTRETNLFRVTEGQLETDDTFSTTSLLGGVNQPFGRQRFVADGVVRHNRYRDNTQLDNTGYGIDVKLEWETIEALSGKLGYTAKEALALYGADQGPVITTKNMERTQELFVQGQYGMVSVWSLEGAYVKRQLDYSAPEYAFQEFSQDSLRLGVLYRPGGSLTLGFGGRRTVGEYPFAVEVLPGTFQPDDFTRNDLGLTAVWVPTGQSTLRVRISYTKEVHEVVTSRDIAAWTGAIAWDYKPTAKLTFTTEVTSDTGAETAFAGSGQGGASSVGNNAALANTAFLRVLYEATAKIHVEASGRYEDRDLVNTQGGGLPPEGNDRRADYRFGVNWMPTNNLLFGCAVGHERRETSSPLSYPYSASFATCRAQFKLQ